MNIIIFVWNKNYFCLKLYHLSLSPELWLLIPDPLTSSTNVPRYLASNNYLFLISGLCFLTPDTLTLIDPGPKGVKIIRFRINKSHLSNLLILIIILIILALKLIIYRHFNNFLKKLGQL